MNTLIPPVLGIVGLIAAAIRPTIPSTGGINVFMNGSP